MLLLFDPGGIRSLTSLLSSLECKVSDQASLQDERHGCTCIHRTRNFHSWACVCGNQTWACKDQCTTGEFCGEPSTCDQGDQGHQNTLDIEGSYTEHIDRKYRARNSASPMDPIKIEFNVEAVSYVTWCRSYRTKTREAQSTSRKLINHQNALHENNIARIQQ